MCEVIDASLPAAMMVRQLNCAPRYRGLLPRLFSHQPLQTWTSHTPRPGQSSHLCGGNLSLIVSCIAYCCHCGWSWLCIMRGGHTNHTVHIVRQDCKEIPYIIYSLLTGNWTSISFKTYTVIKTLSQIRSWLRQTSIIYLVRSSILTHLVRTYHSKLFWWRSSRSSK